MTGLAASRSQPAGKEASPGPAVRAQHPGRGGRQSEPDQGPTGHRPAAGPGGPAPWSQQAGEERPTRAGCQGPRFWAAAGLRPNSAAAQPLAKAEAIGRDWPTSRLGRCSGATAQAGTNVALTRVAISGHSTVGPRPAAARLGQGLVAVSLSGRVPATARTASPGVAAGVCRDGLPQVPLTILKAKVESLSLHSAATNGSHH